MTWFLPGVEPRRAHGARIRHYWEPEDGADEHGRALCGSRLRRVHPGNLHPAEPDRPVCANCERARARTVAGG